MAKQLRSKLECGVKTEPPVPSPSAVIVRRSFSLSGHLRKCPCPSMSNRSASRIRRALGSAVTLTNKCGSVPSFGLGIPRCSLLVLRKSHFVRTTNERLISRSSATCMLRFGFGVASIGGSQGPDFLKNKANIGFSVERKSRFSMSELLPFSRWRLLCASLHVDAEVRNRYFLAPSS